MRNLLNYILRNSSWFLAIILIAFSLYLVFKGNSYQRSVYLSSANRVTGEFYRLSSNVTAFLHLKQNNEELLFRNAELERKVQLLQNQIETITKDTSAIVAFSSDTIEATQFDFIPAKVVNISKTKFNNFITINKGSLAGVKQDMGVISHNGVVGVVRTVSKHFSVIIPVINPKFRIGAKLKDSENFGSVMWNGNSIDKAELTEMPKHEIVLRGDTVITGFSRIFPEGIVIGYTLDEGISKDDNFNTFNIKLATNFNTLQKVLIINDKYYEERTELEISVK